jgi:hypothetical protein
MREPRPKPQRGSLSGSLFWDLLTFERLMTNQVIHLIYWAGLGVIALIAMVLLWRSFCELYVALFRLSDDLHAIRQATDAEASTRPVVPPR